MNREIIASCDIGTSTVKIVVAQAEHNHLNILGVGVAPSDGVKRGQIVDIEKAVQSIRKAVEQAEKMVGVQIQRVHAVIGAHYAQIQSCSGVVAISNESHEVSNKDKEKVKNQSMLIQIPQDREIIEVLPLKYKVDEFDEVVDPVGMTGVRLEMSGLIITGMKAIVNSTIRAIEKAGLEVSDIFFAPFAESTLLLSKDEKELGTCIIDFGGGTTSCAIFREGVLIKTIVVPLGGENITKDLSIVLKTTTEDAERVKIKNGNAFIDSDAPEEQIMISTIGSDRHQKVTQIMVADIVEARATEIFEMISREIQRLGLADVIGSYVLTGGSARLLGMPQLAEYVLQSRVRFAAPNFISVREPQFSASVAALVYALEKSKREGTMLMSGVGEMIDEEKGQSGGFFARDKESKKQPKEAGEGKGVMARFSELMSHFFE